MEIDKVCLYDDLFGLAFKGDGQAGAELSSADLDDDGCVTQDEYVEYKTSLNPGINNVTSEVDFGSYASKIEMAYEALLPKKSSDPTNYGILLAGVIGKTLQLGKDFGWVGVELARQIDEVPEDRRAGLIRLALKNKDTDIRRAVAEQIQYAPEADRAGLIALALKDENSDIRREVVEQIQSAPEAECARLIALALKSEYNEICGIAAAQIKHVPEVERAGLIALALKNGDPRVRRIAVQRIWYVPKAECAGLMALAMHDEDHSVREEVADMASRL